MSNTPSPNDLEQLLQLATRGDLVMFSLEYAKGNKDFQEALGTYLTKKYLHNTETASDYAGQMADAFCETKDMVIDGMATRLQTGRLSSTKQTRS